jgi:hypothetical protein
MRIQVMLKNREDFRYFVHVKTGVTRFDEFSTIGRMLTLGSFLIITDAAKNFDFFINGKLYGLISFFHGKVYA